MKSKLDLISADKVKENGHYLLGQLLSEEAGGKVRNSDNSRSVNRVRGYRRLDTLLCDIAECSRAFTHDHEKKISDEFPDIVRTSARKYEGHEPINARTDSAGDTERDEIGLELAPAGSRLVNYRAEKHIVDNVPNTVDNIRYSLKLQADLKNVGDESLRIRVDIEALRHIIDDVSDSLFRTDIASVPVPKDDLLFKKSSFLIITQLLAKSNNYHTKSCDFAHKIRQKCRIRIV